MNQLMHKHKLFHKNGIGESKKANIYFACVILGFSSGVLTLFILSGVITILSSVVLLTPAIPVAYVVKQHYCNKLHNTVQDVLGFSRSGRIDDFPVRTALRYLGHSVSNYKDDVISDGILYVRFMWNLDYESVRNLLYIVSEKKDVESLVLVYGGGRTTYGVKKLIKDNNIIVFHENDAYDAVYEKIMSDRHVINC